MESTLTPPGPVSYSFQAEPVSPSSLAGNEHDEVTATATGGGEPMVASHHHHQQQQLQHYHPTHHLLQTMMPFQSFNRHDDDEGDEGRHPHLYETKYMASNQLRQSQNTLAHQSAPLQHPLVPYAEYAAVAAAAAAGAYSMPYGSSNGTGSNFSPNYGHQHHQSGRTHHGLPHQQQQQYRVSNGGWPSSTSHLQTDVGGSYGVDNDSAGSSTDSVDVKPVLDHHGVVSGGSGTCGVAPSYYHQFRGSADPPGCSSPSSMSAITWSAATAAQNLSQLQHPHHHGGLFHPHYHYQQQQLGLLSSVGTGADAPYVGGGSTNGLMAFGAYGSSNAQVPHQQHQYHSLSPPLSVHHILRGVYDTLQVKHSNIYIYIYIYIACERVFRRYTQTPRSTRTARIV